MNAGGRRFDLGCGGCDECVDYEDGDATQGAHHLITANIAATIIDLEAIADGTEVPSLADRDWRTACAVLSLQMRHLLSEQDRAYADGRKDEREALSEPTAEMIEAGKDERMSCFVTAGRETTPVSVGEALTRIYKAMLRAA